MDLKLTGRRALITGATRGIGRAIALNLADEGVAISFCARTQKDVEAMTKSLQQKGVKAHGTALDIRDAKAYLAWIEAEGAREGGLDIFIPNVSAGNAGSGDAAWQANFEGDLMHSVRGAEALLQVLARSSAASIILIGSVAAAETAFGPGAYGPMKAALASYGKLLAEAVAPHGIRVNVLSPGPVYFEGGDWHRVKQEQPELYNHFNARCLLGGMATADEVARAAVFLASPAAAAITGSTLLVDRGFSHAVRL
ncbi:MULTISPECIES: SDR family oxidoreductase [unclassified Iodidimonas]|jgi:NAD(P)-dependent dehydrogenase (short-subunit alcohol dehydrogenase family)|uniref:SDR family NAD(P)-dependent oxidoreductase n=1 Tax=unclassified Iodidimonas TaxID=2626145 RepID=UPI0024830F53|nr:MULTISPECIES: SDR family oxidoreductase [unclassified Iodidimonas]